LKTVSHLIPIVKAHLRPKKEGCIADKHPYAGFRLTNSLPAARPKAGRSAQPAARHGVCRSGKRRADPHVRQRKTLDEAPPRSRDILPLSGTSRRSHILPITCILLATLATSALADQEAGNHIVVRSAQYGTVYAKSIPVDRYGQVGTTRVFKVEAVADSLICEYDWYSSEIYLGGIGDRTLVRFGPWQRGRTPDSTHLVLGIYRDGRTIAEYMASQMVALGSGISNSVSHYTIFNRRLGFRRAQHNDFVYEVEGVSGKVFSFDVNTGHIAFDLQDGSVNDSGAAPFTDTGQFRSSPQLPLNTSLLQLIARPNDFNGEYVRVMGFYRSEFEGTGLYVHREDYEHGMTRNGIWCDRADSTYNMQYVLLEGRFDAKHHGHMGLWSGTIADITRMIAWPPDGPRATSARTENE
jgi:hypothetical protein